MIRLAKKEVEALLPTEMVRVKYLHKLHTIGPVPVQFQKVVLNRGASYRIDMSKKKMKYFDTSAKKIFPDNPWTGSKERESINHLKSVTNSSGQNDISPTLQMTTSNFSAIGSPGESDHEGPEGGGGFGLDADEDESDVYQSDGGEEEGAGGEEESEAGEELTEKQLKKQQSMQRIVDLLEHEKDSIFTTIKLYWKKKWDQVLEDLRANKQGLKDALESIKNSKKRELVHGRYCMCGCRYIA